ncbi:type II toxin-antitoxin system PemK/MazF family toxin [Niallia sp. 03091]|uniref:type II toxin-antitoxin system PemK/MazF family toxin n=1 Tax=Niallia sp. 03091 TaxID=3458059 RepID=UPI004043C261
MKRGNIHMADLSPAMGSEQRGIRPVLVIQNDTGNKFSPTVIIAALTKVHKKNLPTHVLVDKETYGLDEDSVITLEQIRTIDKGRLFDKVSSLDKEKMDEVDQKLLISLGIELSNLIGKIS